MTGGGAYNSSMLAFNVCYASENEDAGGSRPRPNFFLSGPTQSSESPIKKKNLMPPLRSSAAKDNVRGSNDSRSVSPRKEKKEETVAINILEVTEPDLVKQAEEEEKLGAKRISTSYGEE